MRTPNVRFALAALALFALALPALAGSITGTVNYEGPVPKLRPQKMEADPGCAKKHSGPVPSEALVLGDGNTLGNVFVQITSGVPSKSYSAPGEPVVLDQQGCRYEPHVAGIMVGQELKVLNSDGLLHNVHALPEINKGFNRAMPGTVTEAVYSFDKAEPLFKIKCDVHPWMGAYMAVMAHPFFDVTGKDGKFEIKGLPAGSYEVEVWHEKLKTKTASVTISGDEAQSANFTFSPPPRKK